MTSARSIGIQIGLLWLIWDPMPLSRTISYLLAGFFWFEVARMLFSGVKIGTRVRTAFANRRQT